MKTALLLCASHNDLYLIRSLRKLGYRIIVTGNVPGQPGERLTDLYIQADYSDKEAILAIAVQEHVDALVQCCNDYGVYTASWVAERLGLPGYDSFETTLLLHNKDKFKRFALDNGIYTVPSFYFDDQEEAILWFESLGDCYETDYPLIVKPVDCSAGNGIQRLDGIQDVREAVENAFNKSKEGRIVVERFLKGTQHGFCSFLKNRKVVAYCSNNEYSFLNPYRVEIDTWPADNETVMAPILIDQIEKMAAKLNLTDGIFHLQYIVENGKPYIIEVMRRIAGNMYGVPAGMVTGFDWDYWETRARCGLSLECLPRNIFREGYFAYKTILAPSDGIISSIHIPSRYDPYLWDKFLLKKEGDLILRHTSEPIGFLFLMFSSSEEMRTFLIEEYSNDCVKMQE